MCEETLQLLLCSWIVSLILQSLTSISSAKCKSFFSFKSSSFVKVQAPKLLRYNSGHFTSESVLCMTLTNTLEGDGSLREMLSRHQILSIAHTTRWQVTKAPSKITTLITDMKMGTLSQVSLLGITFSPSPVRKSWRVWSRSVLRSHEAFSTH